MAGVSNPRVSAVVTTSDPQYRFPYRRIRHQPAPGIKHKLGDKGAMIPNPRFDVGRISPEGIEKIKPYIDGFDGGYAYVRVSGRAQKWD
jgi:hypothetical protein